MKIINLRAYYTFLYDEDKYIEVPKEIALILKQFNRKAHADYERRRKNKAYYSLDLFDDVDFAYGYTVPSPEEIYMQMLEKSLLHEAILLLTEKQMKRVYAHYFLGMSMASIARIEGVDESSVRGSINRALKNLKKIIKIE